ncbi:hypothetical protein KKC45_01235 [Patescibacteria group bacterium]|nr:hypothetical protein [Patescibacteria group bacterium]
MKNKIILSSIVILGIILSGFYLSSKTKNQSVDTGETATITEQTLLDTSDWETCRNEEYGYEFKYPKNWYMYQFISGSESGVAKDISTCRGDRVVISKNPSVRNGWYPPTISVLNTNYSSPEEYLNNISTEIMPVNVIKEYLINDLEITLYERQGLSQILITDGDKLVDVKINAGKDNESYQKELENTIISNFKFIK